MAARSYAYRIVDVFTARALEGNALAVFTNGEGLDDGEMQRVARELNLSETTFVFPSTMPGCAARVRIFTPHRELPFAGHPTIGTAFVLREAGIVPGDRESFGLEEGVGVVPVRVDPGAEPLMWLRTPPIADGAIVSPEKCAAALGIGKGDLMPFAPQILSAGNPTLLVPVSDPGVVDRARIDSAGIQSLNDGSGVGFCVFVFAPTQRGAYARMFAPHLGVPEDPATGSSTGPLAAYMMRHGLISHESGTRFVSEQGVKMGRPSELHVAIHGPHGAEGIDVGGHVAPVGEGRLDL